MNLRLGLRSIWITTFNAIGNRRVAVGGCLSDLIALARFLPKDALVPRFASSDGVARLNVALQCGTARPPLRWHGPFVVHVLQLLAQLDQLRTFFDFFAILFVVKSRVSIAKL